MFTLSSCFFVPQGEVEIDDDDLSTLEVRAGCRCLNSICLGIYRCTVYVCVFCVILSNNWLPSPSS